jgi:hypothetical protein
MRRWILPAAALVLLGTLSAARANEAPPKPPPDTVKIGAREVKLVVLTDARAKDARLIIPAALLTDSKKRADAGLPTIMAGLALTAALVSGGLWLARRGSVRKAAAVALVVSLLALGGSLYADVSVKPPPKPAPVTLPAGVTLSEKLVLEVAEKGDEVQLILPSSAVIKPAKPKADDKEE